MKGRGCLKNEAKAWWWYRQSSKYNKSEAALKEHRHLFDMYKKCQDACITLICVRKFREEECGEWIVFPKDVVVVIAKKLWQTKNEDCWGKQKEVEKSKKCVRN